MNDRTYTKNGFTFKRITKKKAFTAFKNGLTVILSPVNANPYSVWAGFHTINKEKDFTETDVLIYGTIEKDFDAIVNAYEYYNCFAEVGKYAAFWIPVETVNNIEQYNYKFMEV